MFLPPGVLLLEQSVHGSKGKGWFAWYRYYIKFVISANAKMFLQLCYMRTEKSKLLATSSQSKICFYYS